MTQTQNMTLVLAGLLGAGFAAVGIAVASFSRHATTSAELRNRIEALSEAVEQTDARLQAAWPPGEAPKLFVAATSYVKALAELAAEARRASSVLEPLLIASIPLGLAAVLVAIDLLA